MSDISENEWAHIIKVDDLGDKPLALSIEPDEAQSTRLVRRLSVLALDSCEAKLKISRESGHMIHVQGVVEARIRQNCVVSLEPVETKVREAFEAWYADHEQAVSLAKVKHDRTVQLGQAEMPILEERDDPESIIDGQIDVGELITQYLSLGIDPYPHAPGVEHAEGGEEKSFYEDESSITKNPFAALKEWKDKLK